MKTALRAFLLLCALTLPASAYATSAASPGSSTPPATGTASGATGAKPYHPGPCHDDVQKFCSGVKGKGPILACLTQNEGKLSPQCEAGMKKHANDQQKVPAQGTSAPTSNP